ncbi:MAG: hypothetical protein K2G93_01425 [Rikenella sp.]|nr:hypothetical protein [Rikenella sp.]
MKQFKIADYQVSVQRTDHTVESIAASRDRYDSVFDFVDGFEYYNVFSILVQRRDGTSGESLFIVPTYFYLQDCALPSHPYLFLALNNILVLFDPGTMQIVKQTEFEMTAEWGEVEAAYAYQEDFILYGENEIFRIAPDLSIRWRFSDNQELFARYDSAQSFWMESDRICLYGMWGDYYELSYDGVLMKKVVADPSEFSNWLKKSTEMCSKQKRSE